MAACAPPACNVVLARPPRCGEAVAAVRTTGFARADASVDQISPDRALTHSRLIWTRSSPVIALRYDKGGYSSILRGSGFGPAPRRRGRLHLEQPRPAGRRHTPERPDRGRRRRRSGFGIAGHAAF